MAKYRKKLSKKRSKRMFRKHADKTRTMNLRAAPMRGGTRL